MWENLSSGFARRLASIQPTELQRIARTLIFQNFVMLSIMFSECKKQRCRSDCTHTKVKIRLHTCAGWSAPLLFAYNKFQRSKLLQVMLNYILIKWFCRWPWVKTLNLDLWYYIFTYTHANNKMATPIHRFVENKYRQEHVMITKLYIVSHILYDCHLYEYIIWAFCARLKEALDCTPHQPLWNALSLFKQLVFQFG